LIWQSVRVILGVLTVTLSHRDSRRPRIAGLFGILPALVLAGCSSSPTAPTGTSSSTAPLPLSPTEGTVVPYGQQPLTLVITNAVTTSSAAVTYTFEVAADLAFSNVVYAKSSVPAGSGTTSLTVNVLAGGNTYYWRARVDSGDAVSPNSRTASLVVGPEVVLQIPVLGPPDDGVYVPSQPTLSVQNVQRSGPAGAIVYRFEVADSATFAHLVYVAAAVAERTDLDHTPLQVTDQLAPGTYYWRVRAVDGSNAVISPYSAVKMFKVPDSALSAGLGLSGVLGLFECPD
jgi:hypothetical protein